MKIARETPLVQAERAAGGRPVPQTLWHAIC